MKHKFKVGDKVRVLDGSNIRNYTGGWCQYMNKYVGKVYTITGLYEYESGRKAYGVENSFLMFDERGLKFAENKVVIVYVENMTIAKYYENGKCVKTAIARCSPEDAFSEETGAKIALERLFAKSFDWESFKKGEICVLCNKDNYKDFLKAAKENYCNIGNYGDNLFKTQIIIKKIIGLSFKYKELLPDNEIIFAYEENVVKISVSKNDKAVKW